MRVTFSKLGKYGRLGNQLFQIASTIGVAVKNSADFCFPEWEYRDYFKNPIPLGVIRGPKIHQEQTTKYYEISLGNRYDWSLEGYFQSYLYFDHCLGLIKHYFDFDRMPIEENSVAVHVRRGDYVGSNIHPVQGLDYYQQAFELFPNSKFVIFSDDTDWCKENLVGENLYYYKSSSDIGDLLAMASFSKLIIANSSFSVWAAYLSVLNSPETRVVAPKNYVIGEDGNDRLLPDWILL